MRRRQSIGILMAAALDRVGKYASSRNGIIVSIARIRAAVTAVK